MKVNEIVPGVIGYDLKDVIDGTYIDKFVSPVDNFMANAAEINKLAIVSPSQVLGNLIILGYVSAIESYFRAIFRRLILIDSISKTTCERKQLSYGAALNSNSDMLPEALFEHTSLAGKNKLYLAAKEFVGLTLQDSTLPADLLENFNRFSEICELRHCIVHRFGRLGSGNAIALGLSKHSAHIEKPIKCDYGTLQELMAVCQNTVMISNNYLFEKIMDRLIIEGKNKITSPIWTWNYDLDKKLFFKYFKAFYCTQNPPATPHTAKSMYDTYKAYYHSS